jgi:hypothetical protein
MVLGTMVVAGLLVGTLAVHSGAEANQAASPPVPGASSGSSGIACPAMEATSTAIACGPVPVPWCCPGGSMSGITVSGQASLKGEGTPVRDAAIRRAVADAKEQAEVAAQAAGVKLGQVLSMQVSSSGYPYPLEAGAASNGVDGSTVPPGVPCPAGAKCTWPIPVPAQTFVSVTITWAIG